jgi:uncharacterized protein YlxW (UPF0749 family)
MREHTDSTGGRTPAADDRAHVTDDAGDVTAAAQPPTVEETTAVEEATAVEETQTVQRPGASVPRTGQSRMTRFSKAQLLVAVLVAALGFAIVVQLRQTEQQGLASLRQSDLVRILDDVGDRRDRLAAEASDLESQRRELSDVRTGDQAALDAARRRATTLGILAGTIAAKGPGVEVYITDPRATVRAATLLDLVQELRDAGAEAIQIGSARVVASTSFTDVEGGLEVDDQRLSAPYTVRAIGDGQTMATALEIPGGVIASMPQGAHATVATREEVEVTALHPLTDAAYARPAVTPTPKSSKS